MQQILAYCWELQERHFAPGEVLQAEGQCSGKLYVLIEGAVEVRKAGFGTSVVDDPGAMFGETSALLDIPHTATVKVLTACRAYVVDDAARFLQSHPELAHAISRLLAQRLHAVTTYLSDLKVQFHEHHDHLAMVDEVLISLLYQQAEDFSPGSERCPEPPPVTLRLAIPSRPEPVRKLRQFRNRAPQRSIQRDPLGARQREPQRLLAAEFEDHVRRRRPDLTAGVEDPGAADAVGPRAALLERRLMDVAGEHEVRLEALDPPSQIRIALIAAADEADGRSRRRRVVDPHPALLRPALIAQ